MTADREVPADGPAPGSAQGPAPAPAPEPAAGCISLEALRARGPVEETPLSFEHLKPPAPVRRATVFRGRGGVWLISRELACPLDPVACARLFAPLENEAQVRELLTRFERGDIVPEGRAAALVEALAGQGFAAGNAAAKGTALPPGGLRVERGPDGFAARALLLRLLDGGAEVVLARYSFAAGGRATRSEEPIARIASPEDAAPAYEAGAPAPGSDPARGEARAAHEARLKAFWDAVRQGAPELAR